MSDSDTSSDGHIDYKDSYGKNLLDTKSKPTTDTDYYFNMLANPTKVAPEKKSESESSSISITRSDSDTSRTSKSSKSSNSSRAKYEKISVTSPKPNSSYNIPSLKPSISQPQTQTQPQTQPLTPQEIRMKKIELLRRLSEIKTKGFQLTKDYDFNSSIEEMEYEYELLKSFADKRNGVKMYKNILLQATSVMEFLNDKYDPFDFHLSGWSEHLSVETENWDDVWEEIYEKYKGTGKKMAPEVKLLYLIIASASAFHFSKSFSSKLPGLDSVLQSNPGLLSKIINPQTEKPSQFMSAQEINIEKQREELRKREQESKILQQKLRQQQDEMAIPKAFNQGSLPTQLPPQIPVDNLRPTSIQIKAPDQVKEILNRIHSIQPSTIKSNLDTQDDTSSNNDRLVSETTLSDSNPRKRAPKKSNIKIL